MNKIICTTQAELDAVPVDFDGEIIIKFDTPHNRANINRKFKYPVLLLGNSHGVLLGNSHGKFLDNSHGELWDNSHGEFLDNSHGELWDNSHWEFLDNSHGEFLDNSHGLLWDNSHGLLLGNSHGVLLGNSCGEFLGNSRGELFGNSRGEFWGYSRGALWGNSYGEFWANSYGELWGNSHADGAGNAQIIDCVRKNNAKVSGNARIVYNASSIDEYIDFYGLDATEGTVRLFKAVHFDGEKYFADADCTFIYRIGEIAVPTNGFEDEPDEKCGAGINLAHKAWAVAFGCDWDDIAILELECEKADVLVPRMSDGKVRARKAKVVREVPLEECGLYGKMLAERIRQL